MVYHAHEVWVQHLQQQLDHHWLVLLHQLIALVTQKQAWALNTPPSQKSYPSSGPYLAPHGVWQEAAYFLHSLLNLGFCGILLQDAINVDHSGLTNLTVAPDLKAGLVQCD